MTWEQFLDMHRRCGGHEGMFGGSSRPQVNCDCGAYWIGDGYTNSAEGFAFTRTGEIIATPRTPSRRTFAP